MALRQGACRVEDQLEPRAPGGDAGVEAGRGEAQAGPGAGEDSPLGLWASVTSFGLCFLTAVLGPSVPPAPAPSVCHSLSAPAHPGHRREQSETDSAWNLTPSHLLCGFVFLFVWGFFVSLAEPCSMRDLNSQTRDRTRAPCSGSAES